MSLTCVEGQVTFAVSPLIRGKPLARKILLADDSVTAQNMGRKILTDAGYEVITVNNGSAALKKISENKPDLIVLDVYMPGYSGLEVCQRLKENQETARIPVLLTVGKLEPFKPEEAKRARAEAYIVKPFEASELLSTLTKLENKIVPRAEGSKPGRFARANAALDEGRYDKTAADEDSGWKNRIAFPSKKKAKSVEEENGDDPAIYNAVNRDLRTTVERHQEPKPHPKEDDSRVDLAALAPEGLPKDVTAEEIAALAAAAAQMKGKFGENRSGEPAAEPAVVAHEAKTDSKAEAKDDLAAVEAQKFEAQKEVSAPDAPAATFAGQKSDVEQKAEAEKHEAAKVPEKFGEKIEEKFKEKTETPVEAATVAASAPTNETSATSFAPAASADSSSASLAVAQMPASEPMTMAVAAGAESLARGARWTAVAAALAPEETSISLELEMQKAHAAFAAAAAAATGSVVIMPQAPPPPQPVAPVEPPVAQAAPPVDVAPEPVPPSPAIAATSIAEADSAPPADAPYSLPTEPLGHRVKAFESVSSWVRTQQVPAVSEEPAAPASREPEAAAVPSPQLATPIEEAPVSPVVSTVPEVFADVPTSAANQHIQQAAVETSRTTEEVKEEPRWESSPEAEKQKELPRLASQEEAERDQGTQQEARIESMIESKTDASVPEPAVESVAEPEATTQETIAASEAGSAESVPAEAAAAEAPERAERKESDHKDSDMADTTAAAWASWRRIRESGDSKSPSAPDSSRQSESQPSGAFASLRPREETAARAVAAGAEESGVEESEQKVPAAQDSESPEIASIVDSVLADMRPRIVAEISKKLNKKK
jgi:CheY-like chemotaxis protein